MSDHDPWNNEEYSAEERAIMDKAWDEHYAETRRVMPTPGAKLTRAQAQILSEDAVVYVQSRKYPALQAVGSVMVLYEAGLWNFDEMDVYNLKIVPVACLEAEENTE